MTSETGSGFTHLDAEGRPRMVDVGDKEVTRRVAVAEGRIVMGAKRTAELIPLCHSLPLSSVEVELVADEALPGVQARATARVEARTGVEMEALTAVSVALLTIYDMCKARDREMRIEAIRLVRKEGGRSGTWEAGPG